MITDLGYAGREGDLSLDGASVWSADLDELPCLPDVLSSDELARSERFRTSQLRDRYIAGRSWVRWVLGAESGLHPALLSFRYLELGKPVVEHPPNTVDFSLAHSANVALLAVGPPGGLGVDVEPHAPGDHDGLTIHDLAMEDGLVGAIAVPPARAVRYRGRWFGEAAA